MNDVRSGLPVAPGTICEAAEIRSPEFFESPLATALALLSINTADRIPCQNTSFAPIVALIASYRRVIDLSFAFLARSDRQSTVKFMIHVDIKKPVFDFLLFCFRNHVFHWHVDVVGRRNIRNSELVFFGDVVVVRVFNNFIDIEVSIQKHGGEPILILN